MNYVQGIKKYIPKLSYQSKVIQIDGSSVKKTPIVAMFVNSFNNSLIAVTQTQIEVHDLKKKPKKVAGHKVNSNIIHADFTYTSEFGVVLAVSQEDQTILLFEPYQLIKLKSINVQSDNASVTAINCQLGKHIIVGYSNGNAKKIDLKSSKEELEFKYQIQGTRNQLEEIKEASTPVNHIQVSVKHSRVFLSHEENFTALGKQRKTPIQVFSLTDGEYITEYRVPNLAVQSMALLDERDILIVLSAGHHKLFLINIGTEQSFIQVSTQFDGITDGTMIERMFVNYLQKSQLQSKYPPDFKEEILVGFTLSSGDFLTALLKLDPPYPNKAAFSSAQLVAQNMYHQNKDLRNPDATHQKKIHNIHFSPQTDLLVVGNSIGQVKSVGRVLANIIKGNSLGTKIIQYEDPKSLPFFSFKSYKKKLSQSDEAKSAVQVEKENLRLFCIKPNKSEIFNPSIETFRQKQNHIPLEEDVKESMEVEQEARYSDQIEMISIDMKQKGQAVFEIEEHQNDEIELSNNNQLEDINYSYIKPQEKASPIEERLDSDNNLIDLQ